jgi:hypothetical protein
MIIEPADLALAIATIFASGILLGILAGTVNNNKRK